MSKPAIPTALIVGAGLAGATMAIYLARRGYEVEVIERRPDFRIQQTPGPSMNLGLSRRGIWSLTEIGLIDEVMERVIPMYGRMVHDLEGALTFQSYGRREQAIYAVQRGDLNLLLVERAAAFERVRFAFDRRLERIDRDGRCAFFRHQETGEIEKRPYQLLIGADGVHSAVRHQMQKGQRATFYREYLPWGWKELAIPPAAGGGFHFEKNAFHLWPRGTGMLFAHPNVDGSFTCSLVMPYEGPVSFAALDRDGAVQVFFREHYPDIADRVPDLAAQFAARPIVDLVGVRTSRWFDPSGIVLIGDSAHGVVPFFAQGMNAAFEDCRILDETLARHGAGPESRVTAFTAYQRRRQRDTDALFEMSKQNFEELRDRVRSPALRLRKKLDAALGGVLGASWMPLHDIVTHTLKPYGDALDQARRQDRIVRGALSAAGLGLALGLARTLSRRDS